MVEAAADVDGSFQPKRTLVQTATVRRELK